MTAETMTKENRKRQEKQRMERLESGKKGKPKRASTPQVQLDTNGKVSRGQVKVKGIRCWYRIETFCCHKNEVKFVPRGFVTTPGEAGRQNLRRGRISIST